MRAIGHANCSPTDPCTGFGRDADPLLDRITGRLLGSRRVPMAQPHSREPHVDHRGACADHPDWRPHALAVTIDPVPPQASLLFDRPVHLYRCHTDYPQWGD